MTKTVHLFFGIIRVLYDILIIVKITQEQGGALKNIVSLPIFLSFATQARQLVKRCIDDI